MRSSRYRGRRHAVGVFSAAALVLVIGPAFAPAGRAQTSQVTFAKDIAPILQRSCQNCHHPDSVAPMSLMTYEEVRPWARSIKFSTGLRNKPDVMPPWYIEKNIGIQQFKDDMSLSDEEIAQIATWADSGAPRGNPADEPQPLSFAGEGEWRLGKPDLDPDVSDARCGRGRPIGGGRSAKRRPG